MAFPEARGAEPAIGKPITAEERRSAVIEAPKPVVEKKSFFARFKRKNKAQNVPRLIEAKIDTDGKVRILSEPSSPGPKFMKRLRRGLMRLLGKKKQTQDVKEFKK